MSMLLDAVQRQRQSELNHDPALAAMLPRQKPKRQLPWTWLLPPAALAIGAAAGWLWAPMTTTTPPLNVPASTAVRAIEPTLAASVEAAAANQFELAQRIVMPLPVDLAAQRITVTPSIPVAVVAQQPTQFNTAPLEQKPTNQSKAVTEEAVAEPVNNDLLAALEQALADVGEEPFESQLSAQHGQMERLEQELTAAVEVNADDEQIVIPVEPEGKYDAAEDSLDSLSPDMQVALEQALQKVGIEASAPKAGEPMVIPKLGQMPWSFQKNLPDLDVTAHVYASDASKSWLRANGQELQEGDEAAPGLKVKQILPNEIVLEMDNQVFRIPALGSI
ncbi:general secretion pathway protein GspB [Ferrimonas lipolytica]|uniref:General secretion pathway protein GspB n=1 Tax=Ferrimonas lipolytica TaxID=2724191 RepID=A0A6H1UF92_9GAMM|nr:general secretion pathway protein GspB [Ferrimonas lipolytica]QIZ77751.1 general secretion pathway protein GspB [Ferrimonas lipolytica]